MASPTLSAASSSWSRFLMPIIPDARVAAFLAAFPATSSDTREISSSMRERNLKTVKGNPRSRTFSRREFSELPTGQVRLDLTLARSLADAVLGSLASVATQLADNIVSMLAQTAAMPIRVPKRSSATVDGEAKATRARKPTQTSDRRKVASVCRFCGDALGMSDRAYCDGCLPRFKEERTDSLVTAARSTLAEMRASDQDPAKSPEAIAKRVATYSRRKEATRL
jgi:hypothetical protein